MDLVKWTPPSTDDTSPFVESKKKEQLVSAITGLDIATYLHIIQIGEDRKPNIPVSPPAYQDLIPYSPSDLPAGSNGIVLSHSNKSIKGAWVIDTRLDVPSSLASSSSSGAANYNLSLTSRNGSIAADVSLISGAPDRATMLLHGHNGSIKFNLVCPLLPSPPTPRLCLIHFSPPCRSTVQTINLSRLYSSPGTAT
jgi:hypothetical protein